MTKRLPSLQDLQKLEVMFSLAKGALRWFSSSPQETLSIINDLILRSYKHHPGPEFDRIINTMLPRHFQGNSDKMMMAKDKARAECPPDLNEEEREIYQQIYVMSGINNNGFKEAIADFLPDILN